MLVGFKTGPRTWEEGKRIIMAYNPPLCEVWFNVLEAPSYNPIFSHLRQQNVTIGLHHWGICEGGIKNNLATHNEAVRQQTIAQIKQTIMIGASLTCAYVNIHPGALHLEQIDFATSTQSLLPDTPTPSQEAWSLLQEAIRELVTYATEYRVLLTVETLPAAESITWNDRHQFYMPGNSPLSIINDIAKYSYVANDITHTAGMLATRESDMNEVFNQLLLFTQEIASQTKLLHINTVTPPFNGSDSHNGLLPLDFNQGAFPSFAQLRQILTIFTNRSDVFVIPEPRNNMPENYHVLRDLVDTLESGNHKINNHRRHRHNN